MTILEETFLLENGVAIPKIGFGTWQIPEGEVAYQSTLFALQHGYRHVDTALAYGNEHSIGRAVRESGLERQQVFVTSKVPAEIKSYDQTLDCFERTMDNLGLEYLDLYLIHAPWPWDQIGADYTAENIQVWKALEEIYNGGRCRAIGVSNFSVADLNALLEHGSIKPMVNQIRYFIGDTQHKITSFCQERNILVEGYSPLATGAILGNTAVASIAEKYQKTVSQICIRYLLQKDVLPLPKSTHPEYIAQNADVDFSIDAEDMHYLDGLKNTVPGR